MRRMIVLLLAALALALAAGAFVLFRAPQAEKEAATTAALESGKALPLTIRVRPFGEYSGKLFDFAPDPSRVPDASGVYGYADLPKGGHGREPVDSLLVDVVVSGAAGTRLVDAGLKLQIYVVPDKPDPDGKQQAGQLILERILEDIDFGPGGAHHEGAFVIGHNCQEIDIRAEIAKPSYFTAKTTLPLSCGR